MATSTSDNAPGSSLANPIDVAPGTSPFYVNPVQTVTHTAVTAVVAPNGSGSGVGGGFSADFVDGFNAVAASVAGPNVLIATDNNGFLPPSCIIGSSSNGFPLAIYADTYANLKLAHTTVQVWGWATDLNQLYFYTHVPTIGDQGWNLVS